MIAADDTIPYTVELTPQARADYDGIIGAMERSAKTTKTYIDRFRGSVDTSLEYLAEAPYLGRGLSSGDDKIRIRTIPNYDYAIYYEVNDRKLEVLAFAFIPEKAGQETISKLLDERIDLLNDSEVK